MNIPKHTWLTLLDRKEIWQPYQTRRWKATELAERFRVLWSGQFVGWKELTVIVDRYASI